MRRVAAKVITSVAVLAALLTVSACGASKAAPQRTDFPARPTGGLATKLEQPPKFARPGSSKWALNYTPTTAQFLDQFYANKAHDKVGEDLRKQGLREIVHTLWVTDDSIQNDIVLLRFDDSQGAAERLDFVQSTNDGNGLLTTYHVPGFADPVVYYTKRPVDRGFQQAKAYAQVGAVVIEMFSYAPSSVPTALISQWITTQAALLR